MNQFDRARYDVLARVREFGATYGQLFPETSLAPQALAVVSNAVGEIESNDVAGTMASVSARATRKRRARQALEERLLLIAKTAQVLAGTDAELKAHFNVPAPASDQALLTAARQCVQQATPLAAQFVAHGMPAAFLTEVTALINGFEEALRERGMSRDQLVAARTAIREALTVAFKAVHQLDVIVANHLASNGVVREVWSQARRTRYPPRGRKEPTVTTGGAAGAPGPVPAAVPTPVTG